MTINKTYSSPLRYRVIFYLFLVTKLIRDKKRAQKEERKKKELGLREEDSQGVTLNQMKEGLPEKSSG